MKVQQGSTNKFIPIWIVQNGGDYRGATDLKPTVQISKDCRVPVPAVGVVFEVGGGLYGLTPNASDRDTLGACVLLIGGVAAGFIVSPAEYEVVSYDPDAPPSPDGTTVNVNGGGLSPADSNNLRLLAYYTVPDSQRGQIQ